MDKYTKLFEIVSPNDGDMLNGSDGVFTEDGFLVKVLVGGPEDLKITVNGREAIFSEGMHRCDILLKNYCNTITIREAKTGIDEDITVFVLSSYEGKYRLSIDDAIWFLRDLTQNSLIYNSMFENPYLGFLKRVHDLYQTKVHINIYYETDGFNLSQMTCKFKEEWKANSDWLKLSFHAYANDPDMPYKYSGYEKMKNDCEMVINEIMRFAGEEVMGPVTTLHWGEATVEGCRALRDLGYKCLVGDFNFDNDLPAVSYYFNVEQREHINKRFIWRDNSENIIFLRSSIIIDCHKKENIIPFLNEIKIDPHKSSYIDLLIHEQYFYQFYKNYQPDYEEKVCEAVKWAVDNAYKPAFISNCVFDY